MVPNGCRENIPMMRTGIHWHEDPEGHVTLYEYDHGLLAVVEKELYATDVR